MADNDEGVGSRDLNRLLFWMVLIAAVMFALSAYAWNHVPEGTRIPVHWGLDGQPDRYGGKVEGLLLLPGVVLLIAGLFRVLPIIEPRRLNLLRSFSAYRAVSLAVAAFLALLHCAALAKLLGLVEPGVTHWIGFLLGALLMALGNYLGKVRSNFVFGIRTPWTLSSNLAWDRTHRLGGRLYFVAGLIAIVVAAVAPGRGTVLIVGLLIACTLFLVVYSWYVWRDAPDRRTT